MHVPLTIGVLGLLTGAILVLRLCWWRLPLWLQRVVLGFALTVVLIRFCFLASQWSLTSTRLNAVLCWLAVAGYQILLARFSLMRPQWLTSISAVILLFPLLGSTLLIPLTRIFDWAPADISSIGGDYICEKSPWDTDSSGNVGVDLMVYYRPPFAPFLRHIVQRSSFGDNQCDSAASSAIANPTQKVVYFRCPGRSGKQEDIEHTLPLR
jgi:hypothetical protein